jgi:hypothetical protein
VIGCKRGWIRKSMVVMVVQNIHDKKGDVVLICKGVDNNYLSVYHFEYISNLSKQQQQNTSYLVL